MRLALRRPYPTAYDHERSGTRIRPGLAVIALLAAAAIGWLMRGGSSQSATRTVTRTIAARVVPPSVYQHTDQGAVAAAQAMLYRRATTPQPGAFAVLNPRPGHVAGDWQLLYRVKRYSTRAATIRTWGVELSYGFGSASLDWDFTDVDLQWDGSRWVQTGNPLTIVPEGATPPANETAGEADRAFGGLLSSFRRFPGAP